MIDPAAAVVLVDVETSLSANKGGDSQRFEIPGSSIREGAPGLFRSIEESIDQCGDRINSGQIGFSRKILTEYPARKNEKGQ